MPRGRSKLQYRVVCTGDGGREWRVYKLKRQFRLFPKRPKVRLWSSARLQLHVKGEKPRSPKLKCREIGNRADARVWIRELGGYVYFHRVVAYAWQRGRYQVAGGAWVDLLPGVAFGELSHLHVEHGQPDANRPSERVLIGELSFVTAAQNTEIEKERKERKEQNMVFFDDFPPRTPWLDMIENLFGAATPELDAWNTSDAPKSPEVTLRRFRTVCKRIAKRGAIRNMIESMPRRIKATIKANGGPIDEHTSRSLKDMLAGHGGAA